MIKTQHSELAIFGGTPAFAQPLHVGRPNIGDRAHLLERINDLLDRKWLSNNGPYVQEFEQKVADMLGARHCIAMSNGTVALEIAIRALGLTGEVLVPSFTFIATAHALQWQEITPVFCDVDSHTHTLDPQQIEQMITPRTTGVIGVHLWGRACNVEALEDIARRRNLRLLFDASHSFLCSYRGQMLGSFGEAEVFSFHATKFVNAFEGGAVVTNNDALAAKMRLMKNFGFAGYDDVTTIGTNGKMSEVCAAMGLTGLESASEFIAVNRRNYELYACGLKGLPGLRLLGYPQDEACNYQYVVLEIDAAIAGLTRDQVMNALWAENVLARRYFYPGCHRMEPYRSLFPHAGLLLPQTQMLSERVMVLPTGTSVEPEDIQAVCGLLRLLFLQTREIRQQLDTVHQH